MPDYFDEPYEKGIPGGKSILEISRGFKPPSSPIGEGTRGFPPLEEPRTAPDIVSPETIRGAFPAGSPYSAFGPTAIPTTEAAKTGTEVLPPHHIKTPEEEAAEAAQSRRESLIMGGLTTGLGILAAAKPTRLPESPLVAIGAGGLEGVKTYVTMEQQARQQRALEKEQERKYALEKVAQERLRETERRNIEKERQAAQAEKAKEEFKEKYEAPKMTAETEKIKAETEKTLSEKEKKDLHFVSNSSHPDTGEKGTVIWDTKNNKYAGFIPAGVDWKLEERYTNEGSQKAWVDANDPKHTPHAFGDVKPFTSPEEKRRVATDQVEKLYRGQFETIKEWAILTDTEKSQLLGKLLDPKSKTLGPMEMMAMVQEHGKNLTDPQARTFTRELMELQNKYREALNKASMGDLEAVDKIFAHKPTSWSPTSKSEVTPPPPTPVGKPTITPSTPKEAKTVTPETAAVPAPTASPVRPSPISLPSAITPSKEKGMSFRERWEKSKVAKPTAPATTKKIVSPREKEVEKSKKILEQIMPPGIYTP